MFVSYRNINSITRHFKYKIPCYDAAIEILGLGSLLIFIIALDAHEGYRQIGVRSQDQDKVAFFASDDENYFFAGMAFGRTNAPDLYPEMTNNNRDEWYQLLFSNVKQMKKYQKHSINISSKVNIYINNTRLASGRNSVIDDILLWIN